MAQVKVLITAAPPDQDGAHRFGRTTVEIMPRRGDLHSSNAAPLRETCDFVLPPRGFLPEVVQGSVLRLVDVLAEIGEGKAETNFRGLGQALFNWVFCGAVRELVIKEYDRDSDFHMYFTVDIDATHPAAYLQLVPFELLTNDAEFGFWFHSPLRSFVRQLPQRGPEAVLPTGSRLLLVTANPEDDERVSPFEENRLVERLEAAMTHAGLEVTVMRHASISSLQQFVANYGNTSPQGGHFQWLHFLGHGYARDGKGVVLLEKELPQKGADAEIEPPEKRDNAISAKEFAEMLEPLGIKVAFLQSCYSASFDLDQPRLYAGMVQTLLGPGRMVAAFASLTKIDVNKSTLFAAQFYRNLRSGRSLLEARQLALSTYKEEDPEWAAMTFHSQVRYPMYQPRETPFSVRITDVPPRQVMIASCRKEKLLDEPTFSELTTLRQQHLAAFDHDAATRLGLQVTQLPISREEIELIVPDLGFQGDVELDCASSTDGFPWEELPDPHALRLVDRDTLTVVRTIAKSQSQPPHGTPYLSRLLGIDLGPEHGDVEVLPPTPLLTLVKASQRRCYVSLMRQSERQPSAACIVLRVPFVNGRPYVWAGSPIAEARPLSLAHLSALSKRLESSSVPARLLVLDIDVRDDVPVEPSVARVMTEERSRQGTSQDRFESRLIAILLQFRLAYAVLAPLSAWRSPTWQDQFAEACRPAIDSASVPPQDSQFMPLRRAMRTVWQATNPVMPAFFVSTEFRRVP